MRLPWRHDDTTTDAPGPAEPAIRSSDDLAAVIQELTAELDTLAVEHAALEAQAADGLLDGQSALVADLQDRLAENASRSKVVRASIVKAEERRAVALKDENRRRSTLLVRERYSLLATLAEHQAVVVEAQRQLEAAVKARGLAVDRERLDQLHRAVRELNLPDPGDLSGNDPDVVRAIAARYHHLAESATLDEHGRLIESGEQIDPATIPLTDRQREVAALQVQLADPDVARRKRLTALEGELHVARGTLRRAQEECNRDAPTWAERVRELENEQAALQEVTS